jgi:predicted DNA-binding transcriptional regulator AlpA
MSDKPARPPSVWQAMKDGFNANEIAHIYGVSRAVALGMMNEAIPRAPRKPKLKRAA